jgi:RNA polymerase sigma factor (sigma-70 family)
MREAVFERAYTLVLRSAQVHAAAAVLVCPLPYSDRGDLEQEGLLAFWRALLKYDSSRSTIRTFAERVVANQIASTVRTQRALRRTPVATYTSPHTEYAGAAIELRIDVARAVVVLGHADRRLAQLLSEYSPSETCRLLGLSRSTVYEGMYRIRSAFTAAGLDPSSSSSRTPKSHIENSRGGMSTESCLPGSCERDASRQRTPEATA